jgi:hypothetical protein
VVILSLLNGRENVIFAGLKGFSLLFQLTDLGGGDGLEGPRESRRSQGHLANSALQLS